MRAAVALVIGMSLLSACATAGFERVVGVCPPVVEYDAGFQAQTIEELESLPDGSVIVEMMGDYALMRAQARVCGAKLLP